MGAGNFSLEKILENNNSETKLIKGDFKLVATNAKLPQRSLKQLNDRYQEEGISFSSETDKKGKTDAIMLFGPRVETRMLLDAEIAFLNCIVRKTPKAQE